MTFTDWILPLTAVFIIVYGLVKGTPVMDCFIEGAKEGFSTFLSILPALIALVAAVSVLKASGGLDVILWFMKPIASITGIPSDVLPLVLLSPVSGSGSLTMYEDLLKTAGPDSFSGRVASVIMGSTETTFYAVTVYYGAVGVKKTRFTLAAALIADCVSFLLAPISVALLMGK